MKHKLDLRGGSWNNNDNNCRVANRNNNTPTNRNNNIGFRVSNAITLITKPEPIEVISYGCAKKIAQLYILVQRHRSIRNKVSRIISLEHLILLI
ncbi:MAG: hypothetical protein LHW60_03805 [Candidatus Cloacimonetes bacterium]|nr:hypothetical protein [Candidatus Cloacimonadota bacterium]NLO43961.1 hypothetical protein [Candidatus Cloacimonadota bacterium]